MGLTLANSFDYCKQCAVIALIFDAMHSTGLAISPQQLCADKRR
jgi:hypothetical protein